jgi:hypothetical protein
MITERPPVYPRNNGRPPDDLDTVLRAFLRAQMPDPWPAMPAPSPKPAKHSVPAWWPRLSSRFSLAATVALCLVGSLALGVMFPSDVPTIVKAKSDHPDPIASRPYEEFDDKTPDGRPVKGVEEHRGSTTIIKIRPIDLPMED